MDSPWKKPANLEIQAFDRRPAGPEIYVLRQGSIILGVSPSQKAFFKIQESSGCMCIPTG